MKRFLYWLWRVIPLSKRLRAPILWLGNRKFVVGIAVLIRNDHGEILLFKHSYRKDYPWGFPGGYLQKNENPDAAIQREIYEESGFRIKNLKLLEIILSPEMPRLEVLFQADLAGNTAFTPSIEVTEVRFFPPDGLPELEPEHLATIQRYIQMEEQ